MADADPAPAQEVPLEQVPPPARRTGRVAAALVAVVGLVAAGIFAVSAFGDDEENTPEEAVEALLEAAADEDVIGVLEQLHPGERDAVLPGLQRVVGELNRLDLLDLDLEDVGGVDLAFEEVETSSTEVSDDLALVRITSGRSRAATDPSQLPLGDLLVDLFGIDLSDAEPTERDETLETGDDEGDGVVTVREGGRWFVSLGFLAGEAARTDAGVDLDAIEAVPARGASSAEGAVEELFDAVAGLHVRRLIELLPPGEMGALQRYAGLFVDDAEEGAAEGRRQIKAEITSLDLRSTKEGDVRKVFVDELELTADAGGAASIVVEDGCVTVTAPGTPEQTTCSGDDTAGSVEEQLGALGLGDLDLPELSLGTPKLGFVVVEEDDEWFVSPIRTGLDAVAEVLAAFDREDVEELVAYGSTFVEQLMGAMEGGMGGMNFALPGTTF